MHQAQKLRDLAEWYREFAERAGNPAIWDARLRTAEKLEEEAHSLTAGREDARKPKNQGDAMEQNAQLEAKPIKLPGPDHPITIERNTARVVVTISGRIVADTREALTLHEAHYPPVQYIPRKDVDMTL